VKIANQLTLYSILLASAAHTGAQSLDLNECRYLQSQIDHYTQLRRAGGSVTQMEQWKRQRAQYQEEFRKAFCHKYGNRLREPK
jgi:hypothetical protein